MKKLHRGINKQTLITISHQSLFFSLPIFFLFILNCESHWSSKSPTHYDFTFYLFSPFLISVSHFCTLRNLNEQVVFNVRVHKTIDFLILKVFQHVLQ